MYKAAGQVSSYSNIELALMVMLNVYGTGEKRKKNLGNRYYEVQQLVNLITSTQVIPTGSGGVTESKIRKVFKKFEPTSEEYNEFIDEFLNALKEG